MGSPAATGEGAEARGGRRGKGLERRGVRSKSMLESAAPKAKLRSRTGEVMKVALRISPRMSGPSPSLALSSLSLSVITALVRASVCSTATSTFVRTLASSVLASKQEEGRRAEGLREAMRNFLNFELAGRHCDPTTVGQKQRQ